MGGKNQIVSKETKFQEKCVFSPRKSYGIAICLVLFVSTNHFKRKLSTSLVKFMNDIFNLHILRIHHLFHELNWCCWIRRMFCRTFYIIYLFVPSFVCSFFFSLAFVWTCEAQSNQNEVLNKWQAINFIRNQSIF